ncbi:radical SAM family RiPP maturation amino acid epimerase [Fusibacter ferrireducens]|uniref:Radical SAM family RiPP maturation amino acid epimerase n=1 Tax=Fusibacter ferrireducens TaxID=2785058 RepID=A0ABR9ZQ58_9FIRM|nr:radical SAM family RiPP maturation amino acid epimerase [Fusibacter ferrireducens]MBF4692603.1 radical SAM family RiPP maturation amino acid epimerase [Fusibacter ferrireducens]
MDKLYFCGEFSDEVSQEEKRLLPHIKRFFECVVGDTDFYERVKASPHACTPLLESKGIIGVDPIQMLALVPEFPLMREITIAEIQDKPQALLWKRWRQATHDYREVWRKKTEETPHQKFNAWHKRQVNRCSSQMGSATSAGIVHATIAFELSKGCSMQCPFCGLASEALEKVFLYTDENARLWQSVLEVVSDQLGTTAGTGVCYWGTEPTDNPDYFKFMSDFGQKTGIYPQTTTAAATRNLNWTNELLTFRREHPTAADRFSILSKAELDRVHALFSAEDLSMTELILQYSESRKPFLAPSGRNRSRAESTAEVVKDHTIACVTGYLVNMSDKTIKLVSPCPPSDEYPLGYYTFAEGEFSNAVELNDFMESTMEQLMRLQVKSDELLRFRQDLNFTALHDGFHLQTPYRSHKMVGAPHLVKLGQLIFEGNSTASEVIDRLMIENLDVLAIISSIQKLYDQGLLEDPTLKRSTLKSEVIGN